MNEWMDGWILVSSLENSPSVEREIRRGRGRKDELEREWPRISNTATQDTDKKCSRGETIRMIRLETRTVYECVCVLRTTTGRQVINRCDVG